MATRKQIEANRRNAQKSTGAKTPETKAIVSQNRTKHGLCGSFRVIPEIEKQEDYNQLLAELREDEQPVGRAEIELVAKMAEASWRSKRAVRLQDLCFVPRRQRPSRKRTEPSRSALPWTWNSTSVIKRRRTGPISAPPTSFRSVRKKGA